MKKITKVTLLEKVRKVIWGCLQIAGVPADVTVDREEQTIKIRADKAAVDILFHGKPEELRMSSIGCECSSKGQIKAGPRLTQRQMRNIIRDTIKPSRFINCAAARLKSKMKEGT